MSESPWRRVARGIVPAPVRARLRQWHQGLAFSSALRRVAASTNGAAAVHRVSDRDLRSLVYGWGNEGMSAEHELLGAIIRLAREVDGPVLECGSGLSTVLLAAISKSTGNPVCSLEHLGFWRNRVEERVRALGATGVAVAAAPLRDYGEFTWYDAPLGKMPTDFGLVICDGPPGDTPGGRYGLLPVMRDRLRPGAIIILDDIERPSEQQVLKRWTSEFGATSVIEGTEKPYAIVRVPRVATPRRPVVESSESSRPAIRVPRPRTEAMQSQEARRI